MYYQMRPIYLNELMHSGIKGQKWGVRRYQNPDGSLTAEGKKRYSRTQKNLIRTAQESAYAAQTWKNEAKKAGIRAAKKYDTVDLQMRNNNVTERAAKRYNKAQALYRDTKARADFWEKKAREDLDAARKYTKKVTQKHSDVKLKDVPSDIVSAGKEYAKRLRTTVSVAQLTTGIVGSAAIYAQNQSRQRRAERAGGYNPKHYRELFNTIKRS